MDFLVLESIQGSQLIKSMHRVYTLSINSIIGYILHRKNKALNQARKRSLKSGQ